MNSTDLRFAARMRLLNSPHLGPLYIRYRRGYAERRVDKRTNLVIDGFPRSANTFAWHAFQLAGPEGFRVRGHTHASSTVLLAVRRGIPTVVLLRRPEEAVSSLTSVKGSASPAVSIDAYVAFYSRLIPARPAFMVAEFETLTRSFSTVASKCNDRFGLELSTLLDTDMEEEILRRIDGEHEAHRNRADFDPLGVSRPLPSKPKHDEVVAAWPPRVLAKLQAARDLYDQLLSEP